MSAREQKLTLATFMVIAVFAVVTWLGLPLVDRLRQLTERTETSFEKLERLEALAHRLPLIEQRYQAYTRFQSEESEELLQVAFLDEIERMVRAENLAVNLKLKSPQRQGRVLRLGLELDVEATQQELLTFLDHLFGSSDLIEVESLRITTSASPEHPLRANLTLTKVVLRPHLTQ